MNMKDINDVYHIYKTKHESKYVCRFPKGVYTYECMEMLCKQNIAKVDIKGWSTDNVEVYKFIEYYNPETGVITRDITSYKTLIKG